MEKIKWNDGLKSGGRTPNLFLSKGGELFHFKGENIPGVAAVLGTTYEKNGKWSNTTYTLALAEGVKATNAIKKLHGAPWLAQFESWEAVGAHLGVTSEKAKEFFAGIPGMNRGYQILSEREAAIRSLLA